VWIKIFLNVRIEARMRLEKYILDNFVKELFFMFIKLHNFDGEKENTENSGIKIGQLAFRCIKSRNDLPSNLICEIPPQDYYIKSILL